MNGGNLSQKVKFFDYVLASDGAGGFLESEPVLKLETWASVRQIKASTVAENFQEGLNSVYELKLRKRAGFNPQSNYTVNWQNEDFTITEIVEDVKDKKYWLIKITGRGTGL